MRVIPAGFLVFTLVGACAFSPPTLKLPRSIDSVGEIEPYLARAVEVNQPPAITLAVLNSKKTLYSQSFGYTDIAAQKRASSKTVYQWWSLTKLFTAVAVMQLQERGLINIDDPVSKHLPYFRVRNLEDENQPITIRQLLSHSSGLGDVGMAILGWIHYEGDPHFSQTELLKRKLPDYNKLSVQPGEEGRYSNIGYLVLAGLIEEVSGKAYETYIIENILVPLKMEHTNFIYTDSMKTFEATGSHPRDILSYIAGLYVDMDKAVLDHSGGLLWFNRLYSDQKGATGLIGSAEDMTKFMRLMLNKGSLDGKRILSQESIEQMQQPIISVSEGLPAGLGNFDFGLSWFIGVSMGERILAHGGGGMAFVTMLRLYPDRDVGIIVFANSTYLGTTMGNEIVDLLGSVNW